MDAGFSCPNRENGGEGCAFCDPASFSPSAGDKRSVGEQIRSGVERLRGRGIGKVAVYFQPRTNTWGPLAKLREVWDEAASVPEAVALCVGTRPDAVGDEVLDLLAGYSSRFGEIWLELGLQSSNAGTLDLLGRGHSPEAFSDACSRARARGLKVCAHVILGLPGEGREEERETARFIAASGVEGVKLHQLAVVRGTRIEKMWQNGEVRTLSEEEYAKKAVSFIKLLPGNTILHRLCGDTAPGSLIAPVFRKAEVERLIRKEL